MIVKVVGVPYEIEVTDDLSEDAEGECHPDDGKIKLREGTPARQWSKLRHELAHAASFESGFRDRLSSEFGLAAQSVDRLEEAIVGHLVPAFCEALEQAGWLNPPDFDSR